MPFGVAEYFDVDTEDVLKRTRIAVNPFDNSPFLNNGIVGVPENTILSSGEKPDLWGPFWIPQSIIYALFISKSVSEVILQLFTDTRYDYDLGKVAVSASIIAALIFGLPLAVWVMIQYLNLVPSLKWSQTVCLYGYSTAIWIPVAIMYGTPVTAGELVGKVPALAIGWSLRGIGLAISAKFVLSNLRNAIFTATDTVDKSKGTMVLIICGLAQTLFVFIFDWGI